jgi:hypothetical protein
MPLSSLDSALRGMSSLSDSETPAIFAVFIRLKGADGIVCLGQRDAIASSDTKKWGHQNCNPIDCIRVRHQHGTTGDLSTDVSEDQMYLKIDTMPWQADVTFGLFQPPQYLRTKVFHACNPGNHYEYLRTEA